ncbi:MAG TPA: acetyl-coenzyme A synthetase N-terminal domain-containing protein, partial [Saprospiraceae bacterium]|nr:acetyl-coenzyme A synthetase N-terminal domain-containing protein [Saprospiraceae bacterium]
MSNLKNQMDLLWKAPEDVIRSSNLARYKGWVSERFNIPVEDYSRLYQWSLSDRESFWESLLTFFDVRYDGKYRRVCSTDPMPYVKWFEGISLNYAEHVFRNSNSEHPALIAFSENRDVKHWSWKELESRTACIQNLFHRLKLQPGDRVAAYMANIPEASAALLACVSSGLIWSS